MVPSIFRKRHEAVDITPMPGPLEAAAAASSGVDTLEHLKQFEKAHKLDPNLPIDDLTDVDAAIATGNAEKGIEIEHALMEDNSPYPEVCARPPARPLPPTSCAVCGASLHFAIPASDMRLRRWHHFCVVGLCGWTD